MSRFHANSVGSVADAPVLLLVVPDEQIGWCKQFVEEGYDVVQLDNPADPVAIASAHQILKERDRLEWALLTYGADGDLLNTLKRSESMPIEAMKACIHFCPFVTDVASLLFFEADKIVPTIIHLSSVQEDLHASAMGRAAKYSYGLRVSQYNPITVHTYPRVPADTPFPFLMKAPALVEGPEEAAVDIYVRSAVSLSYSRTLELLRRQLGPHFELEKLWEKHTYYEFVERDAPKTMSTMVSAPYVNHIPTMTGGVGYEQLARFYKYHFTQETVTPPDTELITVSRTVGADRIIDEMIFKCTHTTEIDYFLPGVKPTGKPLELAIVGIVAFRGDKLTFEHIYWDQASALVQFGLLSTNNLPVAGVEVARKVVEPFVLPSNTLMERWTESEGLPLA